MLYMPCCTRPDICYAVNKLAKFSNNPGIKHYKALLYLIGCLKGNNTKGLAFYHDTRESPAIYICKKLIEEGAFLKIYDPKVKHDQIAKDLSSHDNEIGTKSWVYSNSIYDTFINADAVIFLTEWEEWAAA